jgi:predicted transcriptional regulator
MLLLAEDWPNRPDDDQRPAQTFAKGLAQARRGEFVPEWDIQALWKRYGL